MPYNLNQDDFVPDFASDEYDFFDPNANMYELPMGEIKDLFARRGSSGAICRPSPWASARREDVRRESPARSVRVRAVWGRKKRSPKTVRLTKIPAERIYGETPEGIIYLPATGVLTLIPNEYIQGTNMRGDVIVEAP